jgi:hypothetical protein
MGGRASEKDGIDEAALETLTGRARERPAWRRAGLGGAPLNSDLADLTEKVGVL